MTTSSSERDGGDLATLDCVNVKVRTKSAEILFRCERGETILAAALSAGFALPYECATGTCGSCHARVMHGTVDPGWVKAPGYAKLQREIGDILMCQASPETDCDLRVRSQTPQPLEPLAVTLKRSGTLTHVERLTHDVVHFDVDLSRPMDFEAGQFVTIRAPGLEGRRAYSMVNFGSNVDRLSFVIKRKPGGGFSDWLFDGRTLGSRLDIVGPLGRATFRPSEERNLVCIAGGSGIAGMMSMLDHSTRNHYFDNHTGHIFFGVRSLADAFYLERFTQHVVAAKTNLEVTIAISHEDVAGPIHPDFPHIRIEKGFVHDVASASMAGRWENAVGFVAGPEPMVNAALKVLIAEAGLAPSFIRYDKFS